MPTSTFVTYRQSVDDEIAARMASHRQAFAATGQASGLNLLAAGDSWFDYPLNNGVPGIRTDVIAQLGGMLPSSRILNLAHYGDATTAMLGVAKFQRLREVLTSPAQYGKFDAILFSGGGNDLCGDQFRLWLNNAAREDADPARAIDQAAFSSILGVVRAAYRDLAVLRDLARAVTGQDGIPIFVHGYDFAIPNGAGVCTLGPWLYPSLASRGWMDGTDPANLARGAGIVRAMLTMFGAELTRLEGETALNIRYVRAQGTLQADQWANELHPKPDGFKAIAGRFASALRDAFPGAGVLV